MKASWLIAVRLMYFLYCLHCSILLKDFLYTSLFFGIYIVSYRCPLINILLDYKRQTPTEKKHFKVPNISIKTKS